MIKKTIFITMAVLGLFLTANAQKPAAAGSAEKVDVVFFTSPFCGFCQRCAKEFLPAFKEEYKDKINFIEYNIFEGENNAVFYDTIREYGLENSGVPAMVIGNSFFVGYPTQIKTAAPQALARAVAKGEKTRVRINAAPPALAQKEAAQASSAQGKAAPQDAKSNGQKVTQAGVAQEHQETGPQAAGLQNISEALFLPAKTDGPASSSKSIFESITPWAILGAGLVDGINPCAFAVIVFFISFLAVYKYDKREIIIIGACYCLSVFVAYILMGLGLFNFLYAMGSFYYVIIGFKWLTIVLCAVFLALSIYDLAVYKITGKADKIILQLPKSYKEYIHKVMRFFLKDKQKSTLRLILASVAVGFIVSLVEAVCTGQVYLPTIVLILKEADTRFWRAVAYLLLYNLMFIVPLVVIFILTLLGYESKGFNTFLKKHLGLTKLLLAMVFLVLLVLLIAAM